MFNVEAHGVRRKHAEAGEGKVGRFVLRNERGLFDNVFLMNESRFLSSGKDDFKDCGTATASSLCYRRFPLLTRSRHGDHEDYDGCVHLALCDRHGQELQSLTRKQARLDG